MALKTVSTLTHLLHSIGDVQGQDGLTLADHYVEETSEDLDGVGIADVIRDVSEFMQTQAMLIRTLKGALGGMLEPFRSVTDDSAQLREIRSIKRTFSGHTVANGRRAYADADSFHAQGLLSTQKQGAPSLDAAGGVEPHYNLTLEHSPMLELLSAMGLLRITDAEKASTWEKNTGLLVLIKDIPKLTDATGKTHTTDLAAYITPPALNPENTPDYLKEEHDPEKIEDQCSSLLNTNHPRRDL